jgi:hypothetical protein
VYFTVAAALTAAAYWDIPAPPSGIALSWGLMQVASSSAVLVTVVVTFVLLPLREKLEGKGSNDFMLHARPLLMHNGNVVLMATELLLGRHTIETRHVGLAVLWGALYVIFAWGWQHRTGIYYYPFLDHTLHPAKAVGCHLGLVAALSLFHGIGAAASAALGAASSMPFLAKAAGVYGFVAMICRFR